MDGAGDDPLAGAGLAKKKDGCVHGSYLLDPEEHIGDGTPLADDLAEVVHPCGLLLQVAVLGLEPVLQ